MNTRSKNDITSNSWRGNSYYTTAGSSEDYYTIESGTVTRVPAATAAFEISGLNGAPSEENITVGTNELTINDAALLKDGNTISAGSYTVKLASGLAPSDSVSKGWEGNSYYATAGYKNPGWTLTDGKVAQVAAATPTLTLTNANITDDIKVDTSKKTVTLTAANLDGKDVTVDNSDYTLKLSDVSAPTTTAAHFDGLTYKSASNTAGYTAAGQTITYTKATKATNLFTLTGVKTTDGITVSKKGVVTLGVANLKKADVTVDNSDYTLKLGNDVSAPQKETSGSWSTLSKNKATYYDTGTTAGYKLSKNKVTYVAAVKGDELLKVSGVKSTKGINVTSDAITINTKAVKADADKAVAIDVTNLKDKSYTISGAEKIGGFDAKNHTLIGKPTDAKVEGKDLVLTTTSGDVTIKGASKATVNTSDGITTYSASADLLTADDSATITSNYDTSKEFAVAGAIKKVNASKANGGITIDGTKASDVIVRGGASADQLLGSKGEDSLYGGAGADTLKGGSGNDKLYGKAGNDVLNGSKGDNTLSGGDGKDKLLGGAGKDSLNGGDGNDTIVEFNVKEDTLVNASGIAYASEVYSDDGLTLQFDNNNSLKIEKLTGGSSFDIATDDKTYTYTADYVTDNKNSVTLYSGATNYNSTDNIISINGSLTTKSVKIVGNASDNLITLGNGGGLVNAGEGNDTIYAGSGSDTVIVSKGNDVIECFDPANDKLSGVSSNKLTNEIEISYTPQATTLTLDTNTVQLNKVAKDAVIGFVNYDGTNLGGITTSGIINANGTYSLNSSASGKYVGDDMIKAIDASSTANNVTLVAGDADGALTGGAGKTAFQYAGGSLTINNYKAGEAVTTGDYKTIKDVSVNGQNVTLTLTDGTNDGKIKITGAKGEVIKLNGTDMRFTMSGRIYDKVSNPTAVMLTSSSGNYDACTDENATKIKTIDASLNENTISITGNGNDNVIIASGGGSAFNGGNKVTTTIEDYNAEDGDAVSVAGLTKNNLADNISKVSLKSSSDSGTLTVELADGSKVEINSSEYSNTALDGKTQAAVNFANVGTVTVDSDAVYGTNSATLLSGFSGKYDASAKFDTTGVKVDASKVASKSVNLIGTSGNDTLTSGGTSSATLQGGAGNDRLNGAKGVKDTFHYAAGNGNDVIADFTSGEDVLKIATSNALSSVSTVRGGLNFNMSDDSSVRVSGFSANNVFIKNSGKLYWFEDIDGDRKGEWVTGTDSATKNVLKSIMKSDGYAIADVDYSNWSKLSQDVKFGASSAYGNSKTVNSFSSYKTR